VGWRRALDKLAHRNYASDFALHEALKREHKSFRNPHVAYSPPACYWGMLNAFIPLDFGSTLIGSGRQRRQVVFVEGAPILPDFYQQVTGVDARALVGSRVVTINGLPALEYFRRYASEQKTHEDAGGSLNGILTNFDYSLRGGSAHDFVPQRPADEFVFETAAGTRQVLELPWVFLLLEPFLGDEVLPASASTQEFSDLCRTAFAPGSAANAGVELPDARWGLRDEALDSWRTRTLAALTRVAPMAARSSAEPSTAGAERSAPRLASSNQPYYEMPPEQAGQDIQEIIPLTNSAQVLQFGEDVTAIRVFDTIAWVDVAREGVEYACDHSQRLIIDVRNNGGGNDTVIRWLHHYLFPEQGQLTNAGLLPLRLRNDDPVFNEIMFNFGLAAQYLPELGLPACALPFAPGCITDVDTGSPVPVSEVDWFLTRPWREKRGGRNISLSRQFGLPNIGTPAFDVASCAGRFKGDKLVFVTNGSNASGGYFLPAAFKGDGVIVNTGGYAGERMAMGRARGGATVSGAFWSDAAQAIEAISDGQISFEHEVIALQRPVDTQMETFGAYREDRRTLHILDPIEADLHVDVWTDSPGSEGFVYERVLRAVAERHPSATDADCL
jgi:hypothetical protein